MKNFIKYFKKYFIVGLLFVFVLPVFAQMPNWKYFCDIEGNVYYFDDAGRPKVVLNNETLNKNFDENFIIVSLAGMEYYMAKAEEYFLDLNYVPALTIIKSVLSMPDNDSRIVNAKKECIKLAEKIKKKIGTRIIQEERKIVFFGYKIKENTVIFVTPMQLKITLNDCEVKLIRQRQLETDYKYSGFTLALQKDNVKVLLAADSEEYVMQRRLRLSNFKTNFYANLPAWSMKSLFKSSPSSKDEFEISEFTFSRNKNFAGYEKIGVNKNIGYCVRLICEEKDFDVIKTDMLKWIENVRAIN